MATGAYAALVPLGVAAVGVAGPYLTYRLGVRNAARTEEQDDRAADAKGVEAVVEGFTALLTESRSVRDDLRDRVQALEARSSEQGAKIAVLEEGRAADRRRITAAVRYIRALRSLLVERGQTPPPVPEELSDDIADPTHGPAPRSAATLAADHLEATPS